MRADVVTETGDEKVDGLAETCGAVTGHDRVVRLVEIRVSDDRLAIEVAEFRDRYKIGPIRGMRWSCSIAATPPA